MTSEAKKKTCRLEPLNDRILVQKDKPEDVSKGGIILPHTAQQATNKATVINVPVEDGDGECPLKSGDRVIIAMYGGTEIKVDDEDYMLISQVDILARIHPKPND